MRGRKPVTRPDKSAHSDVLKVPAWLSKQAKAEWRRVMPLLIDRKILTDADLASLENYCIAIGQVREAEMVIQREGMTVEPKSGLRAHPAVKIQSDAMTRARLLAAELGLTPVSRSRPTIRDDADNEDLSALGL